MDDHRVNKVELEEVLGQKAYILFYICISDNKNAPSSSMENVNNLILNYFKILI